MAEKQKSVAIHTAVIGLVGTILTVCGGLGGALITSVVTIYQVERAEQQVAMPAPGDGETLSLDLSTIFISRQDAAALDPEIYYVDFEQALVLHRPLAGWDEMEVMSVEEELAEQEVACLVVCDQPVYRIRYGEPVEIESDRQTTVNGNPIPDDLLDTNERLYGPPPWQVPFYSQMVLNVFDRSIVQDYGITNLPDLILFMTRSYSGRVNHMIAQEDSHFALVQVSSTYANIRLEGEPAEVTIDSWVLFADSDDAFYTLEIGYTPQSGQSIRVWDDLQTYIDHFRVIR